MNDVNEDQTDPYRSPKDVSTSKSPWFKWGIIGVVVVTASVLGFVVFSSVMMFGFQRARPVNFGAQRLGPPNDLPLRSESATASSTDTNLSADP